MPVNRTNYFTDYIAGPEASQDFDITFDFNNNLSSISILVDDEEIQTDRWSFALRENGVWYVTIRRLSEGQRVRILRNTPKLQPYDYLAGSEVPDEFLITGLNRLTYAVQEVQGQFANALAQLAKSSLVYYGVTPNHTDRATAQQIETLRPLVQSAFNDPGQRQVKRITSLLFSGGLFLFAGGSDNGYYNPWVAVNVDNFNNLWFSDGTDLWIRDRQLEFGGFTYQTFIRTTPLLQNRTLSVRVKDYE